MLKADRFRLSFLSRLNVHPRRWSLHPLPLPNQKSKILNRHSSINPSSIPKDLISD
jgi:hypothetical protein